MYFGKGFLLLL